MNNKTQHKTQFHRAVTTNNNLRLRPVWVISQSVREITSQFGHFSFVVGLFIFFSVVVACVGHVMIKSNGFYCCSLNCPDV